jgi:hypothetical protein
MTSVSLSNESINFVSSNKYAITSTNTENSKPGSRRENRKRGCGSTTCGSDNTTTCKPSRNSERKIWNKNDIDILGDHIALSLHQLGSSQCLSSSSSRRRRRRRRRQRVSTRVTIDNSVKAVEKRDDECVWKGWVKLARLAVSSWAWVRAYA